jgi:phenylalanyl-tRNA synthetase beta chain
VPEVVQGGVELAYAHPVRQARLVLGGVQLGVIAEIHPLVLHKLGVKHTGFFIELDLDALRASPVAPIKYRPLPRFPSVFRDFAVIVDKRVPAGDVGKAIASAAPELIADVAFQSVWTGPGIGEDAKSLAWSVTFRRADRTLTDAEAREAETKIWAAVATIGGRPRA